MTSLPDSLMLAMTASCIVPAVVIMVGAMILSAMFPRRATRRQVPTLYRRR